MCIQWLRFNDVYCFFKDILKWHCLSCSFNWKYVAVRHTVKSTVWCCCLDLGQGSSSLITRQWMVTWMPLSLHHQCKCQHCEKRWMMSQYIPAKFWFYTDPLLSVNLTLRLTELHSEWVNLVLLFVNLISEAILYSPIGGNNFWSSNWENSLNLIRHNL